MTEAVQPTASRRPAAALLALSAAMCALAVFQWIELWLVRHGGAAVCTVNETINCETVWNSALATRVHELLHMPVAGLGLIWGISALVQSVRLWRRSASGNIAAVIAPLRLLSAAGVFACILFAVASAQARALCLTCLGTYLLVLAFALTTFLGLRRASAAAEAGGENPHTLRWLVGVALGAYLVLLVPGIATPRAASEVLNLAPSAEGAQPAPQIPSGPMSTADSASAGVPQSAPPPSSEAGSPPTLADGGPIPLQGRGTAQDALRVFLSLMNPAEKGELAQALADYRAAAPPTDPLAFPSRAVIGDPQAPVRLLDFVDMQCPHCREFHQLLVMLRAKLPPRALAIESRYFPLDAACNEAIEGKPSEGDQVRCVAAKALVCLEKDPALLEIQTKMFEEQATLTAARAIEIASTAGLPRKELESCIKTQATQLKLTEDARLAVIYGIKGTPMVVVNGRQVTALPSLLFVLGLTGGDANVPELVALQ